MKNRYVWAGILGVVVLAVIYLLQSFYWPKIAIPKQPETGIVNVLSAGSPGFERVLAPRALVFPEDHGAHNRYRTEWWYFTGNLLDTTGHHFGYQLTFFRLALTAEPSVSKSNWRSNQMYMAHFTVTDVQHNRFYTAERFSRAGNGLAGAERDKFHVWLYNWSATVQDASDASIHIAAQAGDFAVALHLQALKPLVKQGQRGYFRKGSEPDNASYYYSYTRMVTDGTIILHGNKFAVHGLSWMDREWGTSSMSPQQTGWDWFALQLNDNSELMYYRLRRNDGLSDKHSGGTLFLADGGRRELQYRDVMIEELDKWTSLVSGITYPILWHLSIPASKLELDIVPLIKNQELNVSYRYWEGAVRVKGTKDGQPIDGQGYVELTGYKP